MAVAIDVAYAPPRRRRGTQQMFIPGGSARGPTRHPFTYHFSRKRFPFGIRSTEKWYTFHIPLLEFCIPLTAVNALSFKGTVSRQSSSFCLIFPITRPQSQWNLK